MESQASGQTEAVFRSSWSDATSPAITSKPHGWAVELRAFELGGPRGLRAPTSQPGWLSEALRGLARDSGPTGLRGTLESVFWKQGQVVLMASLTENASPSLPFQRRRPASG